MTGTDNAAYCFHTETGEFHEIGRSPIAAQNSHWSLWHEETSTGFYVDDANVFREYPAACDRLPLDSLSDCPAFVETDGTSMDITRPAPNEIRIVSPQNLRNARVTIHNYIGQVISWQKTHEGDHEIVITVSEHTKPID